LRTFGCLAAGLVVTLALVRPLTIEVLAEGAARALAFPLGYATVGLAWSLSIPVEPWLDQLLSERRPLPLAAKAAAVYAKFNWGLATVLGVTLPALLVPDGRLRSRRWRAVVAGGLLAAVLVLVGFGLAPVRLQDQPIDNPFGLAGGAGAVAAATLLAAALFTPLRRRVQDLVDQRFNRRRYDAARTVESFAVHRREQVDLDALSAELLAVVEQTMQPTRTSLWLRPPPGPPQPG
jgi:hypothetical protein